MTVAVTLVDAEHTERAGRALGALLREPCAIALIGELGAGKTTLARGLARGAGVDDDEAAHSPTFALVHEYRGAWLTVVHADLYRIERGGELDELGWDELLDRDDAAVVVEWADRFPGRMPRDHLRVSLEYRGDRRVLHAEATGPRADRLLAGWEPALRVLGDE